MKNIFIILIANLIIHTSCEKIEDPLPNLVGTLIDYKGVDYIVDTSFNVGNPNKLLEFINNNTWENSSAPDNSNVQFVLLEEFTGHKCIFCPRGTREIIRLDEEYGDTLIPVAIHAGAFSAPFPGQNKYFTDFRVEGGHGETYNTLFQVNRWPSGVINRVGPVTDRDVWDNKIMNAISSSPVASIKLNNFYSESRLAIRSEIEVTWLKETNASLNLQVFLLEDHIIDWQLDADASPQDNPNYEHRHVLRKVINDTYGKQLKPSVVGETEKITYIYPIKSNWKADDLEVVVFIHNPDASNLEVIQANAAYIK